MISDEAVEAAVEALAREFSVSLDEGEYGASAVWGTPADIARAALEAAATYVMSTVADEAFGYAVSAIRGHGDFTTAEAEAAVQDIIDALGAAK